MPKNHMKKILVVDDDDSILLLYRAVLVPAGFEVHCAADCSEALQKFSEVNPDIVLLDYEIPGGCGGEVFKTFRARGPVPVIFISAHDESVFCAEKQQSGVSLLKKPFTKDTLLRAVRGALKS